MKVDIKLKERQFVWETPRNIAILAGGMAALFSALAGGVVYVSGRGSAPAAPPAVNVFVQLPSGWQLVPPAPPQPAQR